MLAATSHGLERSPAKCDGNAMRATCHVYVEDGWLCRLPAMTDDEDTLLDGAEVAGQVGREAIARA
jgi:2Fe-2S ferredoxin